jgi:ureidoacrylate peracid hydrolase
MAWTPPPAEAVIQLEAPTPKAMTLDPKKTLLCIVDMENTFCTPGFQLYSERAGQAIEGASKLLEKSRAAGATIIFIQSIRKPDSIEFTVFGHEPRLLEGTPDPEIVPALTPKPGEHVVQKWTHDPWARTRLDSLLVELGIRPGEWTVLLAGVGTSGCAYCGALGFANRLFLTVIPMDATASGTPEDEMSVYHEYMGGGYNYNMDFTTSELVTFAPAAVAIKEPLLVAP